MLTDAEDVSVWILEPGDLIASGCGPDAKFLVLNEGIFFKGDAARFEPGDESFDIPRFPTEDGVGGGSELLHFGDTDHGVAGLHHQGESVVADEPEAQLVFVELARSLGICSGNKSDHS